MKNINFFLLLFACAPAFSSDYQPETEPSTPEYRAEVDQQALDDALTHAVENDLSDQIQPLVDQGANINQKNSNNENLLMYALQNGLQFKTKHALLQAGINVHHKNDHKQSSLALAMNDPDIFPYVLHRTDLNKIFKKNQINQLFDAYQNNLLTKSLDYFLPFSEYKRLLEAGIDVNHQNARGQSAILKAIEQKKVDLIGLLSWFGATLDLHSRNLLETLIQENPESTKKVAKLLSAITSNFVSLARSKKLKDQALLSLFLRNQDLFADFIANPALPMTIRSRLSECFQPAYLSEMALKAHYKAAGKNPKLISSYNKIMADFREQRNKQKSSRIMPAPGAVPINWNP